VVEITESTVTVDANHPLAGENLLIDIELVDIVYGPHLTRIPQLNPRVPEARRNLGAAKASDCEVSK
jgi:hypothetical protein